MKDNPLDALKELGITYDDVLKMIQQNQSAFGGFDLTIEDPKITKKKQDFKDEIDSILKQNE